MKPAAPKPVTVGLANPKRTKLAAVALSTADLAKLIKLGMAGLTAPATV